MCGFCGYFSFYYLEMFSFTLALNALFSLLFLSFLNYHLYCVDIWWEQDIDPKIFSCCDHEERIRKWSIRGTAQGGQFGDKVSKLVVVTRSCYSVCFISPSSITHPNKTKYQHSEQVLYIFNSVAC